MNYHHETVPVISDEEEDEGEEGLGRYKYGHEMGELTHSLFSHFPFLTDSVNI